MTAIVPSSDTKGNGGAAEAPGFCAKPRGITVQRNAAEATPIGRMAGIAGGGVRQVTIF